MIEVIFAKAPSLSQNYEIHGLGTKQPFWILVWWNAWKQPFGFLPFKTIKMHCKNFLFVWKKNSKIFFKNFSCIWFSHIFLNLMENIKCNLYKILNEKYFHEIFEMFFHFSTYSEIRWNTQKATFTKSKRFLFWKKQNHFLKKYCFIMNYENHCLSFLMVYLKSNLFNILLVFLFWKKTKLFLEKKQSSQKINYTYISVWCITWKQPFCLKT